MRVFELRQEYETASKLYWENTSDDSLFDLYRMAHLRLKRAEILVIGIFLSRLRQIWQSVPKLAVEFVWTIWASACFVQEFLLAKWNKKRYAVCC